jgi:poly(3-hydroxybutyrate) depolymerase
VLPGTTYFYVVTSINGAGAVSKPSNEVSVITQAAPTCITATNYDHVRAGRAHDELSIARANGSNQVMGLDNIFIITTLKKTGDNYYVIGTCPS